jgi:hypothetical protein
MGDPSAQMASAWHRVSRVFEIQATDLDGIQVSGWAAGRRKWYDERVG